MSSHAKSSEIFIDLQWKIIAQLIDALSKGFSMYFVALAASLAFTAGLYKYTSYPTLAYQAISFIASLTALALIGLIIAARGLFQGLAHLDHTLEFYSPDSHHNMQVSFYFNRAKKYLKFATGVCGSGLIIIIIFCIRLRGASS